MFKLGHIQDFDEQKSKEIKDIFGDIVRIDVSNQLEMLDRYYGNDRNIYDNDGGYLVFLKDKDDWEKYNAESGGMLERNNYEFFFTFFDDSDKFVRVDYIVNNETVISVYMPKNLFKED